MSFCNYKEKICLKCGKEYKPTTPWQKYCGSRDNKIGCSYSEKSLYSRNHYQKNISRKRELNLKRYYNITKIAYQEIMEEQNGKCKICGKTEKDNKRPLSIDHCHLTNRVRGILCDQCNWGLGNFGDSPEKLHKAIEYLIESKKK